MKNNNRNNIDDDINLETEFARIGFDYKTVLHNASYVNPWTILMSAEEKYNIVSNCETKIVFAFTLINYCNVDQRCIHRIRVTLLKSVPNSNQWKFLIARNYWNHNGPMPTIEKVFNDIGAMLKLYGAKEISHKKETMETYLNKLSHEYHQQRGI